MRASGPYRHQRRVSPAAWLAVGYGLRQLAELGFGDVQLELIQLLVQRADLLFVGRREHVELAPDPIDLLGPSIEDRLALDDVRAQCIEVVRGLVGPD